MEDKNRIVVSASTTKLVPTEEEEEKFVPHNPLNRPKMHYAKPIIAFSVFVIQFVLLCLIPYPEWWICAIVLSVYTVAYMSFIAKRTVIWLVHLYQNLAPDEVRLKCCFEPSCSEYMILAVQKYGVIRGVYKGIHRLLRCGNEHGIDYP